jgi:hypothetical protein
MASIIRALLLTLLLTRQAFAHKEWVHQYLVRQAYWTLEMQYGAPITTLKDHMGFNSVGRGDDLNPWETGDVSTAVWREDYDDPVWGYGGWFGGGWTASITHFWNADLGDGHRMGIPGAPGSYAPNALEKARVYLFGGQRMFFRKQEGSIIGRYYSYNSLVEFFTTGRIFYEGYVNTLGQEFTNPPLEEYWPLDKARRYAFQILGRVAHLLQDMSVPAHVKDDTHPCELEDPDEYEIYMGGNEFSPSCNEPQTRFPALAYSASTALGAGGILIPPPGVDPIRYLFYLTTQVVDHFPTNEPLPGNNNLPNGTDPFLQKLYANLGPPPASVDVQEIGRIAIDFAIRATAGLFYWFALETGLIVPPVYVPNDYPTIAQALNSAPPGRTILAFGGVHNVPGILSIPSGRTLWVVGEAMFLLGSGAQVNVNGSLFALGNAAQSIVMTKSSSEQWGSLNFDNAGSSWVAKTILSYAATPVVLTNTTNVTLINVTIGNSTFQNYPHDAAIAVYNSSPTIDSITINGQPGSWNGIRFAQGSTGSIANSIIRDCGAGNGIVVQGNSTPQISGNWILSNRYHGIILNSNGTFPSIVGNYISNNGRVGSDTLYNGINFYNSHGIVQSNNIHGNNYGIYAESGSFPRTYATLSDEGSNLIRFNRYGIVAYNNSDPDFGYHDGSFSYGACNKIYSNSYLNAFANQDCELWARGNFWISSPPEKIAEANNSTVHTSCYMLSEYDCSWVYCGPSLRNAPDAPKDFDVRIKLNEARRARVAGNYPRAKALYKDVLFQSTDPTERAAALRGLYQIFLHTKEEAIVTLVASYKREANSLSVAAAEIEMSMLAALGRLEAVKERANNMRSQYRQTEVEKRALILLASLGGFAEAERTTARQAFVELKKKFGSLVDAGLLATMGSNVSIERQTHTIINSGGPATLSAYPNPFNPITQFKFSITQSGATTLTIYDVLGRIVTTLVSEHRERGSHTIHWDASQLPSGIYFARLESAGRSLIQKVVLVK